MPSLDLTRRFFFRRAPLAFLAATAAFPQSNDPAPNEIDVNSARPLSDALLELQQRVSFPINFEELPHEHKGSMISVMADTRRGRRELFSPKRGHLRFAVQEYSEDPRQNAITSAQSALTAFSNSRLPGAYKLVHPEWSVNVLPSQLVGIDGRVRSAAPVMAIPVKLAYAERGQTETLLALLDCVASACGRPVKLGSGGRDMGMKVMFGAFGEPAYLALERFKEAVGAKWSSWHLFYDITTGTYYFNQTSVPPRPSVPKAESVPTLAPPASENAFFVKDGGEIR